MQTQNSNKHCTTNQAAELLGVTPRSIQLWAESGILKAWKTPGGHRRFDLSDVNILQIKLQKQSSSPGRNHKLRIMVIEDEPDLLTLYRLYIEQWNLPLELKTASNGYDGLLTIGGWLPHLVITDLQMPQIDGIQLINTILNNEEMKDTSVVIVTALSQDEIRTRGGVARGVSTFTKPIPFNTLEKIAEDKYSCISAKDNDCE